MVKALRGAYPDEREYSDGGEDLVLLIWWKELERIEN